MLATWPNPHDPSETKEPGKTGLFEGWGRWVAPRIGAAVRRLYPVRVN
jgi:hypothetical protein